jgi:hypothetical protein
MVIAGEVGGVVVKRGVIEQTASDAEGIGGGDEKEN